MPLRLRLTLVCFRLIALPLVPFAAHCLTTCLEFYPIFCRCCSSILPRLFALFCFAYYYA